MIRKTVKNQNDDQHCEFILLKMGYSNQYIFPIEDGLMVLNALSKAREMVTDYNKPKRIQAVSNIELQYMSQLEINAIALEKVLLPEEPT